MDMKTPQKCKQLHGYVGILSNLAKIFWRGKVRASDAPKPNHSSMFH